MKIFKHKSLMGLLYAVLLAIPLVSIISRVIYVQSNKNAYQSYSGSTTLTYYEKYEGVVPSNQVNSEDDLVLNNYYFVDGISTSQFTYNGWLILEFTNTSQFEINDNPLVTLPASDYLQSVQKITANVEQNYYLVMYWFDDTNFFSINGINAYFEGDFILRSYDDVGNFANSGYFMQSSLTISTYIEHTLEETTLDNVFEYSVDSIIQENNFGKIDFLSWFANMFLDNTNQVNNRYLGFANWYMNYIMFVSCAYLLFLVLMWFINFARRLLDRGMNYDW